MSTKFKGFLKVTLESIFRGIVIALVIIFAERMGWL